MSIENIERRKTPETIPNSVEQEPEGVYKQFTDQEEGVGVERYPIRGVEQSTISNGHGAVDYGVGPTKI